MEYNKETGQFINPDIPQEGDKCSLCGRALFMFCKQCNCYECAPSDLSCSEPFKR